MTKNEEKKLERYAKKFDENFNIEGIPLRWFVQRIRAPPKIRGKFFFFRCILLLSEFLKYMIGNLTKKGRKRISLKKPGVLFLDYIYTVKKKKQDKSIKLHRATKIFEKIKKDEKLNPILILCDPISRNSFLGLLMYRDYLLYSYIDRRIIQKSKSLGKEFSQKWKIFNNKKYELFDGRDKDEINRIFSDDTYLSLIIKYYLTFKKIIEENNVEVAVLDSLHGIYNLSIIAAMKKLDRKVVYATHGAGIDTNFKKEFLSNVFYAIGTLEQKEEYVKSGLRKKNMRITGAMIFDEVVMYKNKFLKKISINKRENLVVLFLTSPLVESRLIGKDEYFSYIKKFVQEISQIENVSIIFKLHHREKYKGEYESITKNFRNVKISQKIGNEYLYESIAKSDVVIIFGSTAGIESLILESYVINVDNLRSPTYANYCDAMIHVKKDDDIGKVIQDLFKNKKLQREMEKKRKEYLKKNFYYLDGKAYERIANLIYDLVDV